MPPTVFDTTEKISNALETYANATSIAEAAANLGIGVSTLARLLRKHGAMRMRGPSPQRKIPFNEDYFSRIDSEAKAYWLGFIYADGSVRKNKRGAWSFSLSLAVCDSAHVISLATALGLPPTSVKLRKRSGKKRLLNGRVINATSLSVLVIVRKRLVMDLIRHGVSPNKTYSGMSMPTTSISHPLMRHFVRGFFDGDGSWYTVARKGRRPSFAGSLVSKTRQILDEIDQYLQKEAGVSSPGPRWTKSLDIWRIVYDGTSKAGRLFDFLYQDATVSLTRKMSLQTSRPRSKVVQHGTTTMYQKHKCKCDLCRASGAATNKAARQRRPAQHVGAIP